MRDTDSTEAGQVQVENENKTRTASLVVGSSPSAMRDRIFIILSLLSLYFLWGGTYLAMRIALQGFPPFILAGVRQLTAGILLFLVLWLRKHELPTRKQWLTAIVVGGLLGTFWTLAHTHRMVWIGAGILRVGTLKPGKWTTRKSSRRNCVVYRSYRLGVWIYIEPASSQP